VLSCQRAIEPPRGILTAMRWVVVAAIAAGLVGCSDSLTSRDLYGVWLETDRDVHRAYEFAARSDARPEVAGQVLVYVLRRYPVGQTPAIIEVGRFDLGPVGNDETALTTTVLWDETGSRQGRTIRFRVEDWDGDHVTLREPDGAARRYARVDALP
jgi:hypothetical protein